MGVWVNRDGGRSFALTALPTNTAGRNDEPYVETFGGRIAAVWNSENATGGTDTLFSRSGDGGKTFSAPVTLNPRGVTAAEPLLAVSPNNGALYVISRDTQPPKGLNHTIGHYMRSPNFGLTWPVSGYVGATPQDRHFSISAVDPAVYITFIQNNAIDDSWSTELAVSSDAGRSFAPPIVLHRTGIVGPIDGETHAPRLWARGTAMQLLYDLNGQMAIASSSNSGRTLGASIRLGPGVSGLVAENMALWLGNDRSIQSSDCASDGLDSGFSTAMARPPKSVCPTGSIMTGVGLPSARHTDFDRRQSDKRRGGR